MKKLPLSFYLQPTKTVAKKLIGKTLVRIDNGIRLAGVISETEAYLGVGDPACHTFNGRRTAHTEVMWGPGGVAYVYFIYGMHFCLNVVTRKSGQPEAVLIRGIIPTEGIEIMQKARGGITRSQVSNGPAKLCQALNISRQENGISLLGESLWIEETVNSVSKRIDITPRIGIDYAGTAAKWPLRFVLKTSVALNT
ncbi:MAG: DNA-3-methyladenine glycosylase [Oligoflexia bacterium]|nr:DNA-3-methyladenine glycosylase [Oligoflexia bacterium]